MNRSDILGESGEKRGAAMVGFPVAAAGNRRWLRQAGFTLLELMIVLVVIAILTAIAVPTYSGYVVRTKRAVAASCLSQYATFMERYYTTNLSYKNAVLPTLGCAGPDQTQDYYNYQLAAATTAAYTVQAVPINGQLSRDTKCGTLSLTQTGTRGETGTGTVADCW